jgi:hypothetical protein
MSHAVQGVLHALVCHMFKPCTQRITGREVKLPVVLAFMAYKYSLSMVSQ